MLFLSKDEIELVAKGCYSPSNDERVRAMVKFIENSVFPDNVGNYTQDEMISAIEAAQPAGEADSANACPFCSASAEDISDYKRLVPTYPPNSLP